MDVDTGLPAAGAVKQPAGKKKGAARHDSDQMVSYNFIRGVKFCCDLILHICLTARHMSLVKSHESYMTISPSSKTLTDVFAIFSVSNVP